MLLLLLLLAAWLLAVCDVVVGVVVVVVVNVVVVVVIVWSRLARARPSMSRSTTSGRESVSSAARSGPSWMAP